MQTDKPCSTACPATSAARQAAALPPAELGGHIVGQVGLPVDHPPLATGHPCRSQTGGSMQSVNSSIVLAPASSTNPTWPALFQAKKQPCAVHHCPTQRCHCHHAWHPPGGGAAASHQQHHSTMYHRQQHSYQALPATPQSLHSSGSITGSEHHRQQHSRVAPPAEPQPMCTTHCSIATMHHRQQHSHSAPPDQQRLDPARAWCTPGRGMDASTSSRRPPRSTSDTSVRLVALLDRGPASRPGAACSVQKPYGSAHTARASRKS